MRIMWRPVLPIIIATLLSFASPHPASAVTAEEATSPPPNEHSVLTLLGKGTQIYACHQVEGHWQWQFVAPDARLYDADAAEKEEGTHGNGPTWRYQDASSVTGQLVTQFPSDEPNAIPWLLLKAASHQGDGLMSNVEFIRRSYTHGGAAPTSGCDAQHANATSRIPYSAIYTFYSPKS
ncbi:DUF3455 domain-containing protein [Granulicella sp. dw_53]|uniref:DUF3455 domain-containing protein n=1 Tax=Granulicella sp. dw_53 TaxID=2719792 RepID=UPI0021024997|nr:DUF3455 domain-containing protein [Granulicella sp. dw_53]